MPKIVDHDQRRGELLAKCEGLFLEKGYAAVSMRKLAAVTGVSMGTLYHYFGSKEALFRELILLTLERFRSQSIGVLSASDDPQARLLFLVRHKLAIREQVIARFLVLADYIRCVGLNKFHQDVDFRSRQEEQVQLMSNLFNLPPEKARAVLVFFMGMGLYHFLRGSGDTIESELAEMIRFLNLPS